MLDVIVKNLDGAIRVGFSGKALGNTNPRLGVGAEANFEKFKSYFPGRTVYDMPAAGDDMIVTVDNLTPEQVFESEADALVTSKGTNLLTLRAADCIPLVLYSPGKVALVHVGTAGAILHLPRKIVEYLGLPPEKLKVYIGPSIKTESYKFPADKFEKKLDDSWDDYLSTKGDWVHIDLLGYVLDELKANGIKANNIQVEDTDTGGPDFFSHRRHRLTGEPDGRNAFGVCLL